MKSNQIQTAIVEETLLLGVKDLLNQIPFGTKEEVELGFEYSFCLN